MYLSVILSRLRISVEKEPTKLHSMFWLLWLLWLFPCLSSSPLLLLLALLLKLKLVGDNIGKQHEIPIFRLSLFEKEHGTS